MQINNNRFILVGARPSGEDSQNPGGVLTLSLGLIDYSNTNGYEITIIDTYKSKFEYLPLWKHFKLGIDRVFKIFSLLKEKRYQGVIIFSGSGIGYHERILMSFLCRIFKVRDLFVIVDGWFLEIQNSNPFKKMWIRLLLKVPYKLAASGNRWNQFYQAMGVESQRILPVRYWLPQSFKIAEHPKKVVNRPIRFLFIGWMIKEKGIYEIIDAIRDLTNEFKFSFHFIGGGTLFDEVTKIIHENNWSDNISAAGWVSSADFEKIVDSSDVFVLPSYAEGFPMSLIEAMSKGMPAICSDVGGISDSLHHGSNGYLIPPKEVPPLVEAMKAYIINPNLITDHSIVTLSVVMANHNQYENCNQFFQTFD